MLKRVKTWEEEEHRIGAIFIAISDASRCTRRIRLSSFQLAQGKLQGKFESSRDTLWIPIDLGSAAPAGSAGII